VLRKWQKTVFSAKGFAAFSPYKVTSNFDQL